MQVLQLSKLTYLLFADYEYAVYAFDGYAVVLASHSLRHDYEIPCYQLHEAQFLAALTTVDAAVSMKWLGRSSLSSHHRAIGMKVESEQRMVVVAN